MGVARALVTAFETEQQLIACCMRCDARLRHGLRFSELLLFANERWERCWPQCLAAMSSPFDVHLMEVVLPVPLLVGPR